MTKRIQFFILLINFIFLFPSNVLSQYPPQAGTVGSTAIHRDSSIIKTFANYYPSSQGKILQRGWLDISDTSLGKASVGNIDSLAITPDLYLLSLGDAGSVTFELPIAIENGAGPDFVIFENGFPFSKDSFFLELAFVEVSEDGINYHRFPAYSETDTNQQIGPFGSIKANKVHNLAGKYIAPYGVPFDLNDLENVMGSSPKIRFIKIIDVAGSINPAFASRDALGRMINDPWPTPFPSAGFDLSGIGFIHGKALGETSLKSTLSLAMYPNPIGVNEVLQILSNESLDQIIVTDLNGKHTYKQVGLNQMEIEINLNEINLGVGICFVQIISQTGKVATHKLILN